MKYVYWIVSGASLLFLVLEAPKGRFLVGEPNRGQITAGKSPGSGGGVWYIWTGGGYQGGK